nr:PREDICTED: forkhead box protein H1-like [Stegastes partitus]
MRAQPVVPEPHPSPISISFGGTKVVTSCGTSANKMQSRSEKFGSQRGLLKGSNTYLAKIALALQSVPRRMLTFSQLMDKLAPLIRKDRKAAENNIRVCLSSNKCFIKVPVVPDAVDSKRNYWKLDYGQISAKMVRRHFKGILNHFPELASKVKTEKAVQVRCEVKFSSPFSIESLLKTDEAPTARASTPPPRSSSPVRAEQPLQSAGTKRSLSQGSAEPPLRPTPAGSSSISSAGGSTSRGAAAAAAGAAAGAAEPMRRMSVCTGPSFPIYTRARPAPYFSSQPSSYITYPVPAFTRDALQFWL